MCFGTNRVIFHSTKSSSQFLMICTICLFTYTMVSQGNRLNTDCFHDIPHKTGPLCRRCLQKQLKISLCHVLFLLVFDHSAVKLSWLVFITSHQCFMTLVYKFHICCEWGYNIFGIISHPHYPDLQRSEDIEFWTFHPISELYN